MRNADASQQRDAVRSRWARAGNPVIARSVETLAARADEVSPEQWRLLHHAAEEVARRAAVARAEGRDAVPR